MYGNWRAKLNVIEHSIYLYTLRKAVHLETKMQALTSYLALALCLVGFCAALSLSPVNSPVVVQSGCPNGCPRHEHCGSGNGIAGCDSNLCSTLQMKYIGVFHVCPFFVMQMCVCDDGYLRDDNGKCVLVNNCKQLFVK